MSQSSRCFVYLATNIKTSLEQGQNNKLEQGRLGRGVGVRKCVGMGGRKDLGGIEEEETIIWTYYIRKKVQTLLFQSRIPFC